MNVRTNRHRWLLTTKEPEREREGDGERERDKDTMRITNCRFIFLAFIELKHPTMLSIIKRQSTSYHLEYIYVYTVKNIPYILVYIHESLLLKSNKKAKSAQKNVNFAVFSISQVKKLGKKKP